jgi:uncharacterized membrane protein YkvA (DUF1232 family)
VALLEGWRDRARRLKVDTYALYLAYREPGVPWYARVFGACVVGYLLSPVDLVPDFIPVLGYLDDLIIVPLGITIALKMIPAPVMERCRARAEEDLDRRKPVRRLGTVIVVAIWLLALAAVVALAWQAIPAR